MLRLNPWFRKALDDWEQREALRRCQKRDLKIIAVTLVGGMLLPQAWKPLVFIGILAVGFVVASVKTIAHDADCIPRARPITAARLGDFAAFC